MVKKAQAQSHTVEWIIAIIVVIVLLWIWGGQALFAKTAISSTQIKAENKMCDLKIAQLKPGQVFDDCDSDGIPDSCDTCINNKIKDKNKKEGSGVDMDLDGMDDDCEDSKTSLGSDKIICQAFFYDGENKKTNKCCVTDNANCADKRVLTIGGKKCSFEPAK